MIDMSNMRQDFMPRRRPEEGFTPQMPQPTGGQPPPPGGGMPMPVGGGIDPTQPLSGGGLPPGEIGTANPWVGTGQPQPFTPVGGQPPQQAGTAGVLQQGLPPGMTMEQMPGAGGEAGGFPYPEQWQQAGDIYSQLAGGMPGMTPEYAQQAWLPYQRQGQQEAMQAREQAGLSGMRYSTPLAGQLENIWGGASERFGSEMERMRMQDIQGQRATMLGAAGGLGGLGGAYAQLPGQLAGQAMGLGGQYQSMQQQEYDRQMQEFMRTQPEYSPYLPYMQQGAQVPYGPQTYQPGFASNMMDISGMAGMYGGMGGW